MEDVEGQTRASLNTDEVKSHVMGSPDTEKPFAGLRFSTSRR